MIKRYILLLFACCAVVTAQAQQTMGLMKHTSGSYDNGYVLFSPFSWNDTYLIDKCGKLIHTWTSQYPPALVSYLLPDASIIRLSNQNGACVIEKISWEGQVTWSYMPDTTGGAGAHHDIEPLPNGHFLIISHDPYMRTEMLARGRRDSLLTQGNFLSEKIQELEPVDSIHANIVWEWRAIDHVIQDSSTALPSFGDISTHPELIDINYPPIASGEWLHSNGVHYNPALDQIVLSSRFNSEIWIIDHSTTTLQAASHVGGKSGKGGDLLYRWGNPAAYKRGTIADERFFFPHDAIWIPKGYPHAGDIMVFNNGAGLVGSQYSSADRITPPVDVNGNYPIGESTPFLPLSQAWRYVDTLPGETMWSSAVGGAQMLRNGNVLVSNSLHGEMIEVYSKQERVWNYLSPVSSAGPQTQGTVYTGFAYFKGIFYAADDSAFKGKTLTPGAPIELGPVTYTCTPNDTTIIISVSESSSSIESPVFVYPNPATDHVAIATTGERQSVTMYNSVGAQVAALGDDAVLNTSALPNGMYTLIIKSDGRSMVKRLNVVK